MTFDNQPPSVQAPPKAVVEFVERLAREVEQTGGGALGFEDSLTAYS